MNLWTGAFVVRPSWEVLRQPAPGAPTAGQDRKPVVLCGAAQWRPSGLRRCRRSRRFRASIWWDHTVGDAAKPIDLPAAIGWSRKYPTASRRQLRRQPLPDRGHRGRSRRHRRGRRSWRDAPTRHQGGEFLVPLGAASRSRWPHRRPEPERPTSGATPSHAASPASPTGRGPPACRCAASGSARSPRAR